MKKRRLLSSILFITLALSINLNSTFGAGKWIVNLPEELIIKYLVKKDSNKTLVALCTIPASGCFGEPIAISPFVTKEKWKEYQEIQMLRPLRREDINPDDVLAQATIHANKNFEGNRLKYFDVREGDKWNRVYPKPKERQVSREQTNI